ncbi:uncharacterized protein LOC105253379 [Camponotus floridanus]|uniref:uncharacterized protein LOC105253379 n=1 Tax=Camponotus floridanus TaxID=104421 RepID=UPI00059C5733|nr:uncharacterized protein LOC105253379 [Camponotus floridanus]
MGYSLIAICVLVALILARFIDGRPTVDENGLSMLESRGSNLADFSSYEPKAISSLAQGSYSFPVKSRQKRLSDQRRAELETLVSLSRITGKRSLNVTDENGPTWQLDPVKIGRRKRFAAQIPVSIHHVKKLKRGGDPAYPLVS